MHFFKTKESKQQVFGYIFPEQFIYYCICSSLLKLVYKNAAVHCWFMLVHSALTEILIKY